MTALAAEKCTDAIYDVAFCDAEKPKIGLRFGEMVRLDNVGVEGIADRNVLLYLAPASGVGFEPGQSPDNFLRSLNKTHSNIWSVAHKRKTIAHSEVTMSSGWPVIFTTITPRWSLWGGTGKAWHYSSTLICGTAVLIEQVENENTSIEDMQRIAAHILFMVQSASNCVGA